MTGLLKDNVIALGLLGLAAIVFVAALIMQLAGGLNLEEAAASVDGATGEFVDGQFSLPNELESYAEIDNRPLFNSTRRPIEVDGQEGEGPPEPEKPLPLNAGLTGVIIVEDKMIVVLQDNDTKQYVRTSVGAGMDGAFADWRVEEIGPRSVTLTSFDGETVQLDMQVAETTPAAPQAAVEQPGSATEPAPTGKEKYEQAIMNLGQSNNNESRAEEIRRRIAERRAQLQEAADKKAAQGNGNNKDDH